MQKPFFISSDHQIGLKHTEPNASDKQARKHFDGFVVGVFCAKNSSKSSLVTISFAAQSIMIF